MTATITIYNPDGSVLTVVHNTKSSQHEEEMSKSNLVRLSWEQEGYLTLPIGAYIVYDNVRYLLLDTYLPTRKNEAVYSYAPEFQHPLMYLGKVIMTNATTDSEGEWFDALEWSYTGIAPTLLQYFCDAINTALGNIGYEKSFGFVLQGEVEPNASVSFSSSDILSALSSAADAYDCEWHLDWDMATLYFGEVAVDRGELETLTLAVGGNVAPPSTQQTKDGYANTYRVQGSTRNMTRRANGGEYVATNMRLLLDREQYPHSIISTKNDSHEPTIEQTLIFDDIYPKLDLYAYNVRYRERYLLDADGEKVVDYFREDGTPVYKRYAVWYMRLAYPTWDEAGKRVTKWSDYTLSESVAALTRKRDAELDGRAYLLHHLQELYAEDADAQSTLQAVFAEIGRIPDLVPTGVWWNVMTDITPEQCERIRSDYYATWQRLLLWNGYYKTDKYGKQTFQPGHKKNNIDERSSWMKQWQLFWSDYADHSGILADLEEKIVDAGSKHGAGVLIDGETLAGAFQPNLLADAQGRIIALSSPLAGREFELNFVETQAEADKLSAPEDTEKGDTGVQVLVGDFEIIYKTENDIIIPTTAGGLVPKGMDTTDLNTLADKNDGLKGNIVVPLNIVMGEDYVRAAQERLAIEANKEIARLQSDRNNRTVKSYPHVFATTAPNLYIGKKVTLVERSGKTIETRIQKIVTQLDNVAEKEITVGKELIKGTQSQLKADVKTILSGNFEGAGLTSTQVGAMIDSYGGERFLSKTAADKAQGRIDFAQGLTAGDYQQGTSGAKIDAQGSAEFADVVIRTLLSSPAAVGGFGGQGFRIWQEGGEWNAEFDGLTIRGTFRVYELLVQRIRSIGGQLLVSPASGTVAAAERVDLTQKGAVIDGWKITPDEGRDAGFAAGDLILCQQWTGAAVKRYWCNVIEVGTDGALFINHKDSALLIQNDDVWENCTEPVVGDHIVTCGALSNTDRQSAILIDATGHPKLSMYDGIHARTFSGALKTRLGYLGDVNDPHFGALTGHGLYGSNVYLKGKFKLVNESGAVMDIDDSVKLMLGQNGIVIDDDAVKLVGGKVEFVDAAQKPYIKVGNDPQQGTYFQFGYEDDNGNWIATYDLGWQGLSKLVEDAHARSWKHLYMIGGFATGDTAVARDIWMGTGSFDAYKYNQAYIANDSSIMWLPAGSDGYNATYWVGNTESQDGLPGTDSVPDVFSSDPDVPEWYFGDYTANQSGNVRTYNVYSLANVDGIGGVVTAAKRLCIEQEGTGASAVFTIYEEGQSPVEGGSTYTF